MDGVGDGNDFSGPYAGFPDLSAAPMSSGSDLNNNSSVSMASGTPLFAPQGSVPSGTPSLGGNHQAAPPAKRIKMEPTTTAIGGTDNATLAALTSNRAIAMNPSSSTMAFQGAAPVGTGLSTEQFLQSTYNNAATPAFMLMMQQQQQMQQRQAQIQAQVNAQARAQAQIHRQMQLQRQQQLHNMGFTVQQMAGVSMMQTPALMMMRNPQYPQQHQQAGALQVKLEMPGQPKPPPVVPAMLPRPTEDPVCLVCSLKGEELFVCESGCGLAMHPKCIGEDKVYTTETGKRSCASCFLMQRKQNVKVDWREGGAIRISVRRAILCLDTETNGVGNFNKFGHLVSLRLCEIAHIAGYPIAPLAMQFAQPHMQRWIKEKLVHCATWIVNVRDIFTLLMGLYSVDRVGIPHGWREKTIELVKAKNFSTTDFLGWHPAIEGPSVRCSSLCSVCSLRNPPELLQCARCRRPLVFPSMFTTFISALLASHYAEKVGFSFGTTFFDVFAHTNTVRGHYKGLKPIDPDGHDWNLFVDQMRMVFGLLDIASDFGVLELDPDLFEPEVKLIYHEAYVNQAMNVLDYESVGKFLHCMKLFGPQKVIQHQTLIDACEQFLLRNQLANGGWCKMGANAVDQFKATAACAKSLLRPTFRGWGPLTVEMYRFLVKWAKRTPGNAHAKRTEQLGNGILLACGVAVRGKSAGNLKKLDQYYRRQIVPTSGLNALETLATKRLHAVRKDGAIEPEAEDSRDDFNSGVTDNEDALSVKTEKVEMDAMQDDDLTSMSLNGELSLFDGLKFEDGDVIDISAAHLDTRDDDDKSSAAGDNDEAEGEDDEANADDDDQDERDDEIEDEDAMYDDDDDGAEEGDESTQLPEPDVEGDLGNGDEELNTVDMSILDDEASLEDSFALDI